MITIAELREDLKMDVTEDQDLAFIRSSVIDLWSSLTGGPWEEVVDDVFDFFPSNTRSNLLWCPRRPLTLVTQIESRAEWESEFTILPVDSYIVSVADTGKVQKLSGAWQYHVRVTYTGGYTDQTAPDDVRDALFVQARYMRERIQGQKLVVKGQSTRQGQVEFLENPWVHPRFGQLAKLKRRKFG